MSISTSKEIASVSYNGTDIPLKSESANIEANKTSTVTSNGTRTIYPSSGYDAMAKATIKVNVAGGILPQVKCQVTVKSEVDGVYVVFQNPTATESYTQYTKQQLFAGDEIVLKYDDDSAQYIVSYAPVLVYYDSYGTASNVTLQLTASDTTSVVIFDDMDNNCYMFTPITPNAQPVNAMVTITSI